LKKNKRDDVSRVHQTFYEKTNLAICMPVKIRAENNGIQCYTKGVSELRIPSVEKKFLCPSCWRQFQNPL